MEHRVVGNVLWLSFAYESAYKSILHPVNAVSIRLRENFIAWDAVKLRDKSSAYKMR